MLHCNYEYRSCNNIEGKLMYRQGKPCRKLGFETFTWRYVYARTLIFDSKSWIHF